MTKILLVHPNFEGKYSGMPLGLLYVGTSLLQKGHEVKVIDLNTHEKTDEEFVHEVIAFSPSYVGLASTSPTHLDACNLALRIKKISQVPIIKGGTHETYCYDTTLKLHPEIDFSVRGPGEETICELIRALENGKELSEVNGLAYRKNGKIMTTPERKLHMGLDSYPHPDRKLLESSTFYDFQIFGGTKTTQIRMSRGCSYGCTFCCDAKKANKFHSADYVMDELREIKEQGYGAVFWDDSIFTAHRQLVYEIMSRKLAEGIELKMGAQTRADVHVTAHLLDLMKQAGFVYISFGMESGDQQILRGYNKRLKVSDVEIAVKLAKERGIDTSVTAIIGAPDETLESVMITVDALNQIKPGSANWSTYSVYPGSLLEFDPMWYEDPLLSLDPIWKNFDEGYKAKHARDIEYISKAWELIKNNLDPEIRI